MTWLARLSLANRAIIGVVTVLLVIFSLVSAAALRQELLPSLDVPVATVVTAYPGVSPDVVEQQVTAPIEAAIDGITGVTGTHSTSTGGSSIVVVDLEYGSDLAELTSQFQRAVQGVSLPAGVTPKVVTGSTDSLRSRSSPCRRISTPTGSRPCCVMRSGRCSLGSTASPM